MLIETDVKCLYCGHATWRVELERGEPWQTAEVVWPVFGISLPAKPKCERCGGPVYLDGDYRHIRVPQREIRAMLARVRAGASATVLPGVARATAHRSPSDQVAA